MQGRKIARTAGAYVNLGGRFVFVAGPNISGPGLAVVRPGGHIEAGETPWETARREVFEETSLSIRAVPPPATYWVRAASPVGLYTPEHLEPGGWPPAGADRGPAPPLLVLTRPDRDGSLMLSVMFLATGDGDPHPAAEAEGLLLLTPHEITRVAAGVTTWGEFLGGGGRAVLRPGSAAAFRSSDTLVPFDQLALFSLLLSRHPEISSPDGKRPPSRRTRASSRPALG